MALLKIALNVVEGKEPIGDLVSKVESLVGNAFGGSVKVVENVLETFGEQFVTDFGSEMLTKAEALAPAVITGTTSIKDAGAQLMADATTAAITDAEKDGTVALNALRVQITAQLTPPKVQADPQPQDQAAGTPTT